MLFKVHKDPVKPLCSCLFPISICFCIYTRCIFHFCGCAASIFFEFSEGGDCLVDADMHLVQYLVAFLINLVSGIPLIFALDLVSIALAAPEDGFFNPLNIGRRVNKPTDYQGAICNANRALAQIAAGNQPQSTYTDYTALSNNYQLYSANRWPIDGSLDGVFGTLNIHKANFIRWGGDVSPQSPTVTHPGTDKS